MTDLALDAQSEDRTYPPSPIPEDDLWTHARALFLDGVPGAAVCEALKLPPSTFWKRAATERWLRRDNPHGAPETEEVDFDTPVETLEANAELAWRRMTLAVNRGRPAEALSWMRVHAAISAAGASEARQERAAAMARLGAVTEQARAIERAALAVAATGGGPVDSTMRPRPPQSSTPVEKVECAPSHSTDRLPNRSERRRQMRIGGVQGPAP